MMLLCARDNNIQSFEIIIFKVQNDESSQVYFHYTYVSRIHKQETAKRPCGHQSRLHLVAVYLKIFEVINLTKTNTNKKAQTG